MINALQCTDLLVSGFAEGMEAVREQSADRSVRAVYFQLIADYNDLSDRHNAHVDTGRRQARDLECERANRAEAERMCKLHFQSFIALALECDRLRNELEALKRC